MATRVDGQGKRVDTSISSGTSPVASMASDRSRGVVNASKQRLFGASSVNELRRVDDVLPWQLAGYFMHGGIGIARGGIGTGIAWANDSFVAMSGYDRATIAARSLDWSAITPPEWHAKDREHLAAARLTGYSPTYEKELLRADGSRWPVIVGYTIDAANSESITVFVVDLTAAKIDEVARHAAEIGYARFFEIANVVFWTSDAHGRATFSSTTARRLGIAAVLDDQEAQAALIHPDDLALALRTWQDAVANGEPYDIKVRARGLDGAEFRWTRLRAFPDHDTAGVVVGWYGTSEDIHKRRLATIALEESEMRFRRLADDMPVIVWLTDQAGNTIYLSKRWFELTGQAEPEALGLGWARAVVDEDQARLAPVRGFIDNGESFELDFRIRRADGEVRWVMSTGRPRRAADGSILGYAGSLTDIHARKVAERELADTQLRLSRALDGTGVGVWEWDAATDSVVISGSALNITGFPSPNDDYEPVDYRSAIHRDDRARLFAAMDAYVAGSTPDFEVEVRIRTQQRGWIWVLDRGTATARDVDGRATHMVGTLTNIDDAKRAEARLRWTVEHDALTGLANRTLFNERLEAALANDGDCALALLDIDDFKAVNDLHGHAAGDALLQTLAQRLRDFAYPHETVARLGGDEFTLIIPGCSNAARVLARLDGLRRSLDDSFDHDGIALTCRSSIGVALAPGHGGDASTLLKSADIAMYSAKHRRRGAVVLFEPALDVRARRDGTRIAAIRTALDAGRVVPCYEPIVCLADGSVSGYEALAHIVGETGSAIDIHELDAALGEADLVVRLGGVLLDRVLGDFASWRDAGCGPDFVALNVSLAELRRTDYAGHLLTRLALHGIPPSRFRLDVVETGLSGGRGTDRSEATLTALARSGIQLGLDNFGTGSSSLSHLTRLPLAALKIDAELVRLIDTPGSEQTIVRAIIGLAQSFGLRSVALGVETAAQAAKLTELGCTYGQGSFYGAPTDATATFRRLRG